MCPGGGNLMCRQCSCLSRFLKSPCQARNLFQTSAPGLSFRMLGIPCLVIALSVSNWIWSEHLLWISQFSPSLRTSLSFSLCHSNAGTLKLYQRKSELPGTGSLGGLTWSVMRFFEVVVCPPWHQSSGSLDWGPILNKLIILFMLQRVWL